MKNIFKYAAILALTTSAASAEEKKSIKQIIEEDAARDPYAENQASNTLFVDETFIEKVTETPAPFKIDLDKVDPEAYRVQKEYEGKNRFK